jgi:hypothetical protein
MQGEEEDREEHEAGTQAYIPPEAAAHEGLGTYKLVQDVSIKGEAKKAGDIVYLTHEEYVTLRDLGVHCEAVEAV